MTRRLKLVLLSVLTLAGCSPRAAVAPELPKSVSPGWRLARTDKLEERDWPKQLKAARALEAWQATYEGPGVAHARLWALPAESGLDLVQRWTPQPNTVVFYSPRYFAAVDWSGADRISAGSLVRGIERAIGPEREPR